MPAEVAQHNQLEDLWVSYLGNVYDLTPLLQEYKGDLLLKPIVEVAGQDISPWFDPDTRDIGKAHRSTDRFPEISHPPGPLSACAASAAPFRLGQWFREALVAGVALPGGAAVRQDPEYLHH